MTEVTEKEDKSQSPIPVVQTKQSIRRQVWDHLEKNNLVNFPRPVYGRIPNFKGCEEAAIKISELNVFKNALNILVNPDKPQEPVRFSVLEHQKNLFVPIPRLTSGLLKHIILPENALKDDIRRSVSRRGIDEAGKEVGIEDEVKIDLVVLGSVAVSKEGLRIGKGKGYADLEFAILSNLTAVNSETIVVTTIHDSQLFDTLPLELFGPHDVPVDIIVTPTQVIEVEPRGAKPQGVIWGLVSQRRLDLMPVLKNLHDLDKNATLKEIDSDVENRPPRGRSHPEKPDRPRRRRTVRRKPQETETPAAAPKRRPVRKNRSSMIDFSLIIRNIEKSVRVRDLKEALAKQGIKPNIITWRGMKGYCCLHFSKTNPITISDPAVGTHGVDNILGMLQNLSINNDQSKLTIEIMKPVSRIETTDVTAV